MPAKSAETKGRGLMATSKSKGIDIESRRAWFVASTNEVDRYGTIVLPVAFAAGLDKFRRHSPFLAAHAGAVESVMPTQIGTVDELKIDKSKVTIAVTYAHTDLAEQYWRLAADPKQTVAVSIGFMPLSSVKGNKGELLRQFPDLEEPLNAANLRAFDRVEVFDRIELLEVSQVSVPANSQAVQLAAQEGTRNTEHGTEKPGSGLRATGSDADADEAADERGTRARPGCARYRDLFKLAGSVAAELRQVAVWRFCDGDTTPLAQVTTRSFLPKRLHRAGYGQAVAQQDVVEFAESCDQQLSAFDAALGDAFCLSEMVRLAKIGAGALTDQGYRALEENTAEWLWRVKFAADKAAYLDAGGDAASDALEGRGCDYDESPDGPDRGQDNSGGTADSGGNEDRELASALAGAIGRLGKPRGR